MRYLNKKRIAFECVSYVIYTVKVSPVIRFKSGMFRGPKPSDTLTDFYPITQDLFACFFVGTRLPARHDNIAAAILPLLYHFWFVNARENRNIARVRNIIFI